MFDSKKILDALLQGAAQPGQGQGQSGLGGGLGGLLGSVLSGVQQQGGNVQGAQAGLGGLLGGLLGAAQGGQAGASGGLNNLPGGLGGLLGGLLGGGGAQPSQAAAPQAQGGGIGDILGSLLGQATGGAREAAQRVEDSTGIQAKIADAIQQATGRRPSADMVAQVQEYISNNPGAAAAAAAGAGGLVLGTRTGRSLATSAVKLGGLALIGGLAYRAYQNYVAGKPPLQFGADVSQPPRNSAFSPDAGDSDSNAMLMLRGMIAAAAADGKIDENEKKAILGNVQALGMDNEAIAFLNNEVANPADAATLAADVQGPEQATALYTACLLAVNVDNRSERRFMDELAEALGLDEMLVKQIEASTEGVKAA